MDAVGDDDAAMMAMMGMSGFGSTKVCHLKPANMPLELIPCVHKGKPVEGNQDGGANVKKIRTWRQYMNRSVMVGQRLCILCSC
jgi:U4/U6.U5 tri-snRNP-associated protein 3